MVHVSVPKPPGGATGRQGNADLWSAQPAAGGRREGPRVRGWFASRPGPRRSASSGRLGGTRLSLRFAQRCRPPPGETPMNGSTRSPRPYECAVPRWCTSRCPSHQAERRAGKGTPTSGRHSPPQAGGGKDPEFGGGSPLGRDPGVQRHPGGWVVHAFRCASRSGADQRFRRSLACGAIRTVEVPGGAAFSQQLPRGRCSLACASLRLVAWAPCAMFSVRVAPSATPRALPSMRNAG